MKKQEKEIYVTYKKEQFIRYVKNSNLIGYVLILIIGILIAKFIMPYHFNVASGSMEPTLEVGDKYYVSKFQALDYEHGDIVVFEFEKNISYVKRIIGMEGDVISINTDGTIMRNGEIIEEEYLLEPMEVPYTMVYTVPEGCVFFLGDNRNNSNDSRYWSDPFVNIDKIIGIIDLE